MSIDVEVKDVKHLTNIIAALRALPLLMVKTAEGAIKTVLLEEWV